VSLLDIRWMGLTQVGTNNLLLSRSSMCLLIMGFPLTYIAFCTHSTWCFYISLSVWAPSALCLLCISNSVPSTGMLAFDMRHHGHGKVLRFLIQVRSALSLQCISPNSDLLATMFLLQPLLPQNTIISYETKHIVITFRCSNEVLH